jgi:hypothetical protein
MAIEKLKLTTRLKIKTWGNQQIQNNKNSHGLLSPLVTTEKSKTHLFTFLTPLTPTAEKTVHLRGFKQVYTPRNINAIISQCGSQQHGNQCTSQVFM